MNDLISVGVRTRFISFETDNPRALERIKALGEVSPISLLNEYSYGLKPAEYYNDITYLAKVVSDILENPDKDWK